MAPRGLSADEKRVKLLEIFHDTKDFFQLKELEKLGPKMKGIVSQSVKEVLQSLVDDNLVQTDKIGSSNFFWSFPSQRGAIMQNRLDVAREARATSEKQLAELQAAIAVEIAARPESEGREAKLARLATATKELTQLQAELIAYGACDPVKVEEKRRAVMLAREAALRHTDNYAILMSHFTRQHNVEPQDIRTYLGVGLDYEELT
ncbi:meiotic nuclear division protein 1 [Multifurca ochricompacta]|uniref:Meiotic nuclear division protein 1 n=1 Tax=Multifurca ochricompacta TaxID=376703 RepID=A0AAD4MAW5_9AGAM|nr:meiotic nuclear division protein 1 [Multifurca ochricompacta]